MRRCLLLIGTVLVSLAATAQSSQWKWVQSLDCAQIKVNGKGWKGADVSAYSASAEEKDCCRSKNPADHARTRSAGLFELKNLKPGFYFLVFEKQSTRIIVPAEVKVSSGGNCLEDMRSAVIQVNQKTGEVKIDSFVVIVD
jgi:hypothetical protein